MDENSKEKGLNPTPSAEAAAMEDAEDAVKRLRISPRKVLGSLSHLRIDKARIKPIEGRDTRAGGNADVEAAVLSSPQASSTSTSDHAEYIAVKKLRFDIELDDDRALAPLAHEVNLLNELSHENVVKIVGFVEDVGQGVAWMVFAWEKNGNLREFIRSEKWELPERISLINDVARGLSYLHGRDQPICHGDLKSLNILVNSDNLAVITDFGSARAVDPTVEELLKGTQVSETAPIPHQAPMGAQEMEALTADMAPSGEFITMTGPTWTIRWAAPELLEGDLPGLASDVWAFGWICWEAVTGNFPFDKENDVAVVTRIAKGDLPTVENDDQFQQIKALCNLMKECWSLDPSSRPTVVRCQQGISRMGQASPSPRDLEGNNLSITRSSGLLYALGKIQLWNSRLTEAQEYFEQSLKVAESVGDKRSMAIALRGIGETFNLRREYSTAGSLFLRAHDIFSQIGDRLRIADVVRCLGYIYRKKKEYSKAEESYIQACEISSQVGDQFILAASLKGLGEVYRMQKDYPKAEKSFIQAQTISSQIGDMSGLARSLEGVADIRSDQGEYGKAEESYVEAQRIYQKIGDMYSAANVSWFLAQLHRKHAQYAPAERLARDASSIYAELGLKQHEQEFDKFLEEIRRLME